jgi:hypothetical protein
LKKRIIAFGKLPAILGSDSDLIWSRQMSLEHGPSHALYVQWGKFKAGAFGIPAIVALILFAGAAVYWGR